MIFIYLLFISYLVYYLSVYLFIHSVIQYSFIHSYALFPLFILCLFNTNRKQHSGPFAFNKLIYYLRASRQGRYYDHCVCLSVCLQDNSRTR